MSENKMIIRNCPAYNDMPNMYDEIYGYCDNEHCIDLDKCMCENINDCILKQIVQMCKKTCRMRCTNDCLGTKKHCGYGQILKLLDIEECDNENSQN